MIIDIAVNARQTVVHVTRRNPRGGPGTLRRYSGVSRASIARLQRVVPLALVTEGPQRGALRATITK